jgi:hypothetical protein
MKNNHWPSRYTVERDIGPEFAQASKLTMNTIPDSDYLNRGNAEDRKQRWIRNDLSRVVANDIYSRHHKTTDFDKNTLFIPDYASNESRTTTKSAHTQLRRSYRD